MKMIFTVDDERHRQRLCERERIIQTCAIDPAYIDYAGLGQCDGIVFSAKLSGRIAA
jgi:hypothetical protein